MKRHLLLASKVTLALALAAVIAAPSTAMAKKKRLPQYITDFQNAANSAPIENIVVLAKNEADQMGTNANGRSIAYAPILNYYATIAIHSKTAALPEHDSINKVDEIGENAAFILNGILPNPFFSVTKKSKGFKALRALTLGIVKTSIAYANAGKANPLQSIVPTLVKDVAGSVALTLHNSTLVSDAQEEALQAYLTNAKVLKALVGKKNFAAQAAARAGFNEGFYDVSGIDPNTKYEDGGIPSLGTIADPETDQRNG